MSRDPSISPVRTPAPPSWPVRVGWFLALYGGSVVALGAAASLLRLWLKG